MFIVIYRKIIFLRSKRSKLVNPLQMPWLICLLACLCFFPASTRRAGNDDTTRAADLARIRFIAEGWIANYESFKSYRSRIQLRQGKCSSVETARLRGPDREVVQADATLVVDGERLCYVRKSNEKPQIDPHGRSASMALPPCGLLVNDERVLDVSFFAGAATLEAKGQWRNRGIDFTTWNEAGVRNVYDDGHFGPYLLKAIAMGRGVFQLHAPAPVRGRTVTRIDARSDSGGNTWCNTWFVDEQRGFIPIEMWVIRDGRVSRKAFVTDIRECSRGRWFPTRCVGVIIVGDEEKGDHSVLEIEVTSLEVDVRPTPEEFQISLPEGSRVYNGEIANSVVTLPTAKVIALNDLASWDRYTETRAQERNARKSPRQTPARVVWLIAALGAALLIMGVVVALRHRRR